METKTTDDYQYARSLIEASINPIVTIATTGKIRDINEVFAKIAGKARHEIIGTDLFDYFTDPQKIKELCAEVLAKDPVINEPLTIRNSNGQLAAVLFNGSAYKDGAGVVLGIMVVLKDMTEKNILREKLVESENLCHSIIDTMPVAVYTCNLQGDVLLYNKAAAELWGREPMLGRDCFCGSWKAFTVEGVQMPFEDSPMAKTLQGEYRVNWGEIIIERPDGAKRNVLPNPQPIFDKYGNISGAINTLIDITEIRDAQKALKINERLLSEYSRSLIEASRDPLFTISLSGKITDINEATVKATGVSRAKLIGSDFVDYFTNPGKAAEGYMEAFAKGFVADYPLIIKDHKLTDVLINGSVYKDDKGVVLGVVVVSRDITHQKVIEKELTEAKVFAELATVIAEEAKGRAETAKLSAEEALKSKQQFLSNMSHEIRTPMNAIIGFTKVLLKTDLSPKQTEYLSAIKLSGDALIVLINDILDLAKVDAGKMTFEQTPFKLASSISAMLHLFETKIQEKNLVLVKEYDNNIPAVLVGDPVRLHQIILNLVSNAVKFTPKGKIMVNVSLVGQDAGNVAIKFSVMDTGIGIKSDKLESIFDNFQQASSGTSRLYGGTGLGLAIVKQLVERQGGSISVTSKLGEGSVFSFVLNFQKTKAEAVADILADKDGLENRNIKVLVVEDIALNQLLMKTLLDDFGFERDIAENGKIAIEKMKAKAYDIILMDLQMPEMNGFEATEYIRNTMHSKVPIIALTADVTTVDLEKCTAVGMNDYIAKPVDEKLLYNKIVKLVKQPVIIVAYAGLANGESKIQRCIDLNYLNQRTKSNPALMMEMIALYLEQTPPLITAMKKGLLDKDWKSLYAAVHKIIPSFLIMGISTDFENMAKKVQEYAATLQQTDEITGLVLRLETVCMQACRELEEEFNIIKNTN